MAKKSQLVDAKDILASAEIDPSLSNLLLEDLNKNYGKVAYSLGEEWSPTNIDILIPTGCTLLDTILSNDLEKKYNLKNSGLPTGRVVEIFGDNNTGKSLIANQVLINTQKIGGIPILFDEENGTSIPFLKQMGMKLGDEARQLGLNNLIYVQAGSVESVFEGVERIINKIRDVSSDKVITIVWDSIAATPTKEELDKGYDENTMATKARKLSLGFRKLSLILGQQKVLFLATNQIRSKFGVMFGDPTDTPGGYAMKFHASIRIRLYKNGEIKDKSSNVIGAGVKAKIIKNKIAPQGRQCEFNLYFSRGIDDDESNFNFLVKTEFIRKPTTQSYELDFNGATHKFKTTQWRESVESIPGLKDFLKQKVKEKGILDLSYDAIQIDESTGTAKIENSNETD